MFHLDFRQNEQHLNTVTETRKLFNQLNSSENRMDMKGNNNNSQNNSDQPITSGLHIKPTKENTNVSAQNR